MIYKSLTGYSEIILVGIYYVAIATFVKMIFAPAFFAKMVLRPVMAEELIISLGFIILDILIAIGYIFIAVT